MEHILEDTEVCLNQGIRLMAQMEPQLYAQAQESAMDLPLVAMHARIWITFFA